MGVWYEISHIKHQPYQLDSWSCTTAEYSNLTSDGTYDVYNSSESEHQTFGKRFGVKVVDKAFSSRRWWELIVPLPKHLKHTTLNLEMAKSR